MKMENVSTLLVTLKNGSKYECTKVEYKITFDEFTEHVYFVYIYVGEVLIWVERPSNIAEISEILTSK